MSEKEEQPKQIKEVKRDNKQKNLPEKPKQEKKKERPLYDKYKRDLGISQFVLKKAINSVDDWVLDVENHRNYRMESEFNKERNFKIVEQNEIKNQIERLSNNKENEIQIQYFNSKISEQQDLFNDYNEMNEKVLARIKELKENIPTLEETVKEYTEELKKMNKENLKLMDQISMVEREINYHNNVLENQNLSSNINNSSSNNNKTNISSILDSPRNQSYSLMNNENNYSKSNNINNSSLIGNKNKSRESINLNEIIEENEEIKNQYIQIMQLKKIYKSKKKENKTLLKNIADMNTECFTYKKIFNEGIHEIAKELLKLHEMQLDKVINNKGNNKSNINSIYFELVKSNGNGNDKKNDTLFKLPQINANIITKYKFPINEKRTPETLIFNVIKKMVNESHNLNKAINLKKNKFSWEEFKTFSAYQIFTILNLNKRAIQKLESYIFPNKIVFPSEYN